MAGFFFAHFFLFKGGVKGVFYINRFNLDKKNYTRSLHERKIEF